MKRKVGKQGEGEWGHTSNLAEVQTGFELCERGRVRRRPERMIYI